MFVRPIEPLREIAAYEALWAEGNVSYKKIADMFSDRPGSRPSDFVKEDRIEALYEQVKKIVLSKSLKYKVGLLINGTFDFPERLKDAKEPLELLYYSGNINLLYTNSVAVVGARKPTEAGIRRTEQLVRELVKDGFSITSGLASGIDTAAHTSAIKYGGSTIAVIGTPLDTTYPKENAELQQYIALNHLLVSQVPFYRYKHQPPSINKFFFPERNKTMSALTLATIIVEASETSGTLIQARAAIKQGRQLFILDSCFHRKDITWPERFLKMGAIRVKEYSDIRNVLLPHSHGKSPTMEN